MAAPPPPSRSSSAALPLLRLGRSGLHPLEAALSREWLLTDAHGGYASSTVLLCPTRRYHGLLVATPPGSTLRHLFLSRFEEVLRRPTRELPLSTGRYPGVWHPTGWASLERFELAPHPVFHHQLGRTRLTREILLLSDRPLVISKYRLESLREDIELRLRPLLAFREIHALTFENLHLRTRVERGVRGGVLVRPYPELPPLGLSVEGADAVFEADPTWYRNVEYRQDLARGYEGCEDSFNPGWFQLPLRPGATVYVGAGLEDVPQGLEALWDRELARRRARVQSASEGLAGRLEAAADTFVIQTATGRTGVIAGYPWFEEWGRDTAISLPGLLLRGGDSTALDRALTGLLPWLRRGLLPNIFGPTPEESHYGSADAALFFVRAVRILDEASGPEARVPERFRPALRSIADAYLEGTDLGLFVDEVGLLHAGGPDQNVTWMDARTLDGPVTPRHGCPVELNALWYFLLAYLERLDEAAGDAAAVRRWRRVRRRARAAFLERFWLPNRSHLADLWRDGVSDPSVRPNMVIAAALEWSPLTRAQRTDVVNCIRSELLTPYGLRTLSPEHSRYRGRYDGDTYSRDMAYHQGTVWPWLLGFYCEAVLRAFGPQRRRIEALRSLLLGFEPHLQEAGLGTISEVFDGDPPHRPGGAIAQAWSVAEWLRAWRLLEEMAR